MLEDVTAIKITDLEAIEAAGISRSEVARRLYQVYLKQVFEDGFFHADPHPGNLFAAPLEGEGSGGSGRPFRLHFVDFGMVGWISPEARRWLREAAIGLGTRDAGRIVRAMDALGFLLPEADRTLVRRAVERLLDRIWGLSIFRSPRIFCCSGAPWGCWRGWSPGRIRSSTCLKRQSPSRGACWKRSRGDGWSRSLRRRGGSRGPPGSPAEGFQRLIWQLTGLVRVMMGLFAGLNHQPPLAGVLLGIGRLWLLWGLRPLRRRREGGG